MGRKRHRSSVNEWGNVYMYPKDFNIDENNLFLNAAYENQNYKVINGISGDICLIFCSGNGLYFPNELEIFQETIIFNDRYEWTHTAVEMIYYVKKIIFIRDVRKNFYVTGISRKINCIDKLIEMLKEKCRGYKIIAIGNSAGGYIASIIGAKLRAKAVFNFSGQWNLYGHGNVVKDYYFLNKFSGSEMYNKYYDISQLVKDCGVPIFYFYPNESEQDIKQASYIQNISNIYFFAFDSNKHGQGLLTTESYIKLFLCDNEMLEKLSNNYRGVPLKPDQIDLLINKLFPYEAIYRDIAKAKKKLTLSEKYLAMFKMMTQWVKVKQEGKNLAFILEKRGYYKIAIYGLSYVGEALIRELEETDVQVAYGIDRNANLISSSIDVVLMEDKLPEVDAIVVTAISFFEDIKNELMSKIKCPILSLEDILYEA